MPEATPLTEAERLVIEQAVSQRFVGVLDHPAMIEISRVAIQLATARGEDAHD